VEEVERVGESLSKPAHRGAPFQCQLTNGCGEVSTQRLDSLVPNLLM